MMTSASWLRALPPRWVAALLLAACSGSGAADSLSGSGPSPDLWSLQPLRDAPPPASPPDLPAPHPVDAFLHAGFAAHSLAPSPPASRRTLLRRVCYDLTGLPPTPAQLDAFEADPRPDSEAFATVVDDLLASPHYGERWGRHWLDVVRYADTAGENSDHPVPHAWRYRNWVIDAFNRDLPYDRFVQDQVAGDLLHDGKPAAERNDAIVATGYLAVARRFGHDADKSMHLTHEDVIDNLGKAFLGLSISCARCHDHKHDPITQRDYYALYSVFDSTRFSFPGCEATQQPRDLVPLPDDQFPARRQQWESELATLQANSGETRRAESASRLKELAAAATTSLSRGDVPDGQAVPVVVDPVRLTVRAGEVVQLSILPRGNHGADTTVLDFTISHGEGAAAQRWSPADHLDDLLAGNPHPAANGAAWCFLDTTGGETKFLAGRLDRVQERPELQAWENGAPPSVLVNASREAVPVWTTLPPRTFFCHPGPHGPVSLAWLSPLDGQITIELKIRDGHPGGDGVAWHLEHLADPRFAETFLTLGEASRPDSAAALAAHLAAEPRPAVAYAVSEGTSKPARLQERGEPELLGAEVPRRFPGILGGGPLGADGSSGRRDLARYLTDPANPLVARVMVNRIWTWHFGHGLIATPNDFGHHGSPPSHPALLDFLARRFLENGWSVKAMHRLLLSSAAYQRAAGSGVPPESFAAFPPRRLSAEELRDTLLVAAGRLDRSPAGPHPFPIESQWNFTQHNPFAADYQSERRSIYLMRRRNSNSPFFALFNGADPNASSPQRELTTTPSQALYFLNDPFFHTCGERFSARIRAAATDPAGRLAFACREIFTRPATADDEAAFASFAAALTPLLEGDHASRETELWNSYARILLGSNELLHLD